MHSAAQLEGSDAKYLSQADDGFRSLPLNLCCCKVWWVSLYDLCAVSCGNCGKILTSEPEPAVEKPEGHSDGVHYHFSLDPFLVLLFQEEKASVQLDNLSSE